MKTPVKATLIAVAVAALLVLAAIIYALVNRSPAAPPEGGAGPGTLSVVRESSHVLDDGGPEAVTVVEFLDFECEACGAFYPIVEDLRGQYAGEITYVVRYFPLPGHFNSKNAAIAAEAAAGQDRFEDMYHRLFETQAEWGEAQESRADLFRSFAEELGLDMAAYDAAVADPATAERVELDFNEGRALGVGSTPTFFVDGELQELQEWGDLEAAIQAAVNGES
ncbi:DsbA family protein [Microbacterium sp. NPDC006705]|uniref:Thioredoxin-like fold domain-containing protein n=2 Tax=Microbacterium TaxID=33882 RepID=A0A9W6HHK6_9MICO|nr:MULTISPECIES: thioredoxin domain-containing protein [Microbacterium]MBP2420826.1 protein-disulfide isomerase [Microbacterium imperiale]MCZ4069130.1 thioredoxin domain-containing protein [Microbacterium sp. H37-C3]MDD7928084.1 thioredoxin domain-containing protein [Microbacterium thalli]MDD7963617.1 thioredoxin domain-containing protein [Microbacterium thalli]MDN8550047.1 thioredoxin domain-containing protein [Microbacterium thalli]